MTLRISRWALLLLAVTVLSIFLPALYNMLFDRKMGKTQLFFSPVIQKFVYREMVGEGHRFTTRDEDGNEYNRMQFEMLIPFIYYKNMDLWGKLPLVIGDRTFTKKDMKKNRQVFQIKPRDIQDRTPRVPVFPLLESKPGVTRLRFPEDVFRITDKMEFINVDTNRVDDALTRKFTDALKKAGFQFPAQSVSGKVSILKPFDEGFFLVDATQHVFHIKRVKGEPAVVKTPIPTDLGIRHIKVSENRKKEIHGMLLTETGDLYLMTYDDYGLIKLPLEHYDPETMDFKLLINPLYRTAVYSDHKNIYAVAMDENYRVVGRYNREMFLGKEQAADRIFKTVFPFHMVISDKTSGYLQFRPVWNGARAWIGMVTCLILGAVIMFVRRISFKRFWPDLGLVFLTGPFGLISVNLIEPEG
ncbi:MAG: DUF4857 domain-containing protein [Deltaproteobacteria bacterium]|nr:DUF4857 domain-containing protein [Deltaproteobacteria bacterium]